MAETSPIESLLRRDRLVVIAALGAVIVACWAYILTGAGMGMSAFETTSMAAAPPAGMAGPGGDGHGRKRAGGHARHGHGGDVASLLDARVRRPDVLHVVDHDDGDDAAERRAHDPPVRPLQPQAA